MSKKLVFGDETRSRLMELYGYPLLPPPPLLPFSSPPPPSSSSSSPLPPQDNIIGGVSQNDRPGSSPLAKPDVIDNNDDDDDVAATTAVAAAAATTTVAVVKEESDSDYRRRRPSPESKSSLSTAAATTTDESSDTTTITNATTTTPPLTDVTTLLERVANQKPLLGGSVSVVDIQKHIFENSPFISVKQLDPSIDLKSRLNPDHTKLLQKGLNALPNNNSETCTIVLTRVMKFPGVRFYPAAVRAADSKFYKLHMFLKVGKVPPNSSVRVNTGYIVEVPSFVKTTRITSDCKIEKSAVPKKQEPYVIVPEFKLDEKQARDIIPCVSVRDPEDTGLLAINFTTISGKVGILQVNLQGFAVADPRHEARSVYLKNPVKPKASVIKGKDLNNGRYTLNFKHLFDATSGVVENGEILYDTFDKTKHPLQRHKRQKLALSANLTALVSSRKREWYNPKLVTTSGINYIHDSKLTMIKPSVVRDKDGDKTVDTSDDKANTHCVTFLKRQVHVIDKDFTVVESNEEFHNLKSTSVTTEANEMKSNIKCINGAFYDMKSYVKLREALRSMIAGLDNLKRGAEAVKRLKADKKDLDVAKALLVYDYRHFLDVKTLTADIKNSELGLFDSSKMPYSAMIYSAMKTLTSIYDNNNKKKSENDDFVDAAAAATVNAAVIKKKGNNAATGGGGDHDVKSPTVVGSNKRIRDEDEKGNGGDEKKVKIL